MKFSIREANIEDWEGLSKFFSTIYRKGHPLQNRQFWKWQFGDEKYGRSFICVNEKGEIVGHVGANFGGGVAWIINVYLFKDYRGKGILRELYALARKYYPLAATAANDAGLGLYRNMRWIRYYDLIRLVKINPEKVNLGTIDLCASIDVNLDKLECQDTHYFRQPFLKGICLGDGSRAVSQNAVGGLRLVDVNDVRLVEEQAWELGYNWIDYISSWNDITLVEMEKEGWVLDKESKIPWRLNPVQVNYFSDITFLSEGPLDKDFIVHRSYSDHGRIGSID
ncbi:GNAT family N-acetyltransferase [Salinimicrobium oceani]|uniref:GNAT family N-acetyltransferase n=1 Tax=Salinimicrobium oceani TaxID=2722702 RepID=A0ABX1D647_9FLAO|nr:GNAT family N-acetyltransferase [Salinimicrobium oceani]NJW54041.1 GNAT family N-acetyltransferase [Salinimicrobium oceani]